MDIQNLKDIRGPKYIWVIDRLHHQNYTFLQIHTNPGTALLTSLLQSETKDRRYHMYVFLFQSQNFFYVIVKRCICLYVYYFWWWFFYLFVEVWLWPIQSSVKGKNDFLLFQTKGRVQKTIESMIMLIPRGGLRQVSAHTSLGFFSSSCSKPICLAQGSPKTDFVLTPNTIFHIVSHLCDLLDQASYP